MSDRRLTLAALVAVLLVGWASGTISADTGSSAPGGPFPEIDAISGNVGFWVRVFSEWTLGQAAVHDLDHPELIYEVVDLPGTVGERYTEEQRNYLEKVRESWEDFLAYLGRKAETGEALTELETEWVLHVVSSIGPEGLEKAHERVRTQRGMRERFRDGLSRAARYEGTIREIFREHDLPEDLAYLPHVESSFQYHARSSAGATGLWQFTRSTGRQYMTINSTIDERLDPIAATYGAAGYLRDAYEKLGNWPLALTSYNHGVQGMSRAVEKHGADFNVIYRDYKGRSFGFASKNFYAEFLAAREIAMTPGLFFPEGYDAEPAFDLDHVVLDRRAAAKSVALVYDVPLDELVELNLAWSSKAVRRGAAIPSGTRVWLPAGKLAELGGAGATLPSPGMEATQTYAVRRGDTLSDIAKQHGVSVSRLREWNGIPSNSSLIRQGQLLVIAPDISATVHIVERGETLSEIASAYGVKLSTLRDVNGLSSRASMIRVGQELKLPADATYREPTRRHVVRRGDTLLAIALRYGIRLSDLLRANALSMDAVIRPGESLSIP